MIMDDHQHKPANFIHGRVRPWLRRIVVEARSVKLLYQAIRRSGLKRAFWVLDYIDGVLGGQRSFASKLPVDRHGHPLPWYTYPTIEYLQQLDFSMCSIFEYGSGNSSRFWSQRSRKIITIESNPDWYESGIQDVAANQELLLITEKANYANSVHLNDCTFDVIIIDGVFRLNCAIEAIKRIKEGGIILLDNSDWLPNTAELLRDAGFSQVDFIGAGPINSYAWCTSIFFQEQLAIPRRCDRETITVQGGIMVTAEQDRLV